MNLGFFSRGGLMAMVACGSIGLCVSLSSGDQVIMRDGTVYTGTVVSQTRREVVIDTEISGIQTRMTLDRRMIQTVTMGEAEGAETPTEPGGISAPSIPTLAPRSDLPPKPNFTEKPLKRDGVDLIVEIPMNGTFGEDIYPLSIAEGLEWAKAQGATDVVFRMNSPGGEVWAAEEIVEIMAKHSGSFRYHALIEHAISATIWPAFNCDTITMAPGGTFGGAVVFRMSGTGAAEVDKKMTSIMAAKLAASAEAKGHSAALVKSMMIPEEGAYAVKKGDTWEISSIEPAKDTPFETIDGKDTVLTLTADQAGKFGIGTVISNRDIATFAEAQGFEAYDHHAETTGQIAKKANDKCKDLRGELLGTTMSFYREAESMGGSQSMTNFGSTIQTMRRQLGRYKVLLKRAEDLQMAAIVSSFDKAIEVEFWETEIQNRLADMQRIKRARP
jgi:hypothetical protein